MSHLLRVGVGELHEEDALAVHVYAALARIFPCRADELELEGALALVYVETGKGLRAGRALRGLVVAATVADLIGFLVHGAGYERPGPAAKATEARGGTRRGRDGWVAPADHACCLAHELHSLQWWVHGRVIFCCSKVVITAWCRLGASQIVSLAESTGTADVIEGILARSGIRQRSCQVLAKSARRLVPEELGGAMDAVIIEVKHVSASIRSRDGKGARQHYYVVAGMQCSHRSPVFSFMDANAG